MVRQRTLRILIVDGDEAVRKAVASAVESLSHEVVGFAASAPTAVTEAHLKRPDAVLIELEFDGPETGIAAARTIKDRLGVRSLFMTSVPLDEVKRLARGADALGYLSKPFGRKELAKALALVHPADLDPGVRTISALPAQES